MARLEMTLFQNESFRGKTVNQDETHLIGIHITLSTTPGLEYNEWEMINELSRYDLQRQWAISTERKMSLGMAHVIGGFLDCFANLGVHTIADIDNRGSLLQNTERFDQRGW